MHTATRTQNAHHHTNTQCSPPHEHTAYRHTNTHNAHRHTNTHCIPPHEHTLHTVRSSVACCFYCFFCWCSKLSVANVIEYCVVQLLNVLFLSSSSFIAGRAKRSLCNLCGHAKEAATRLPVVAGCPKIPPNMGHGVHAFLNGTVVLFYVLLDALYLCAHLQLGLAVLTLLEYQFRSADWVQCLPCTQAGSELIGERPPTSYRPAGVATFLTATRKQFFPITVAVWSEAKAACVSFVGA